MAGRSCFCPSPSPPLNQAATPRPEPPEAPGSVHPWVALASAWALPGLGHFLLGRRWRALIFALLVVAALAIGLPLEGKLDHFAGSGPLAFLGSLASLGMGAPWFVLHFLLGYAGDPMSGGWEYGTVFIRSAGLMNLLVALDAFDIARGRKE